jgi:hypothetical protein
MSAAALAVSAIRNNADWIRSERSSRCARASSSAMRAFAAASAGASSSLVAVGWRRDRRGSGI